MLSLAGAGLYAGLAGAGVVVKSTTLTEAIINDVDMTLTGDLSLASSSTSLITMGSGALGGGAVGVGASVAVVILDRTTNAAISSSEITAETGSIDVSAKTDDELRSVVGTASVGAGAVAGSVFVADITDKTSARIENGTESNFSTISAQSVDIDADSYIKVNESYPGGIPAVTGAVSLGGVGAGASVDVVTIDVRTNAYIGDHAELSVTGDIDLDASSDVRASSNVIAFSGGFVGGIAGAVSVITIGSNRNSDDLTDSGAGNAQVAVDEVLAVNTGGLQSDNSDGVAAQGTNSAQAAQLAMNISATDTNSTSGLGGTRTFIGEDASVDGNNISLDASEYVRVNSLIGGAAAGGNAAIGGAVGIVTLAGGTYAYIEKGAKITAAGDLTVSAEADEITDVYAVGGAIGGFVGLGAQVAIVNDSSEQLALIGVTESDGTFGDSSTLDGADANSRLVINAADNVKVAAEVTRDHKVRGAGIQVGAVAAGAAIGTITVDGKTQAAVANFTKVGLDTDGNNTVGSLEVSATSVDTLTANMFAVAAGIGAGSGQGATITYRANTSSNVGAETIINLTGALSVKAEATPKISTDMFGVAAGGLAVAASVATINYMPWVIAKVGNGTIDAGSMLVDAKVSTPSSGDTFNADATGSAGALVGVTATQTELFVGNESTVSNSRDMIVRAGVDSNQRIDVDGAIDIGSNVNFTADIDSSAYAGGLVAAGAAISRVRAQLRSEAYLGGSGSVNAGSLSVGASSDPKLVARATAGSGGVFAGAGLETRTEINSSVRAMVGSVPTSDSDASSWSSANNKSINITGIEGVTISANSSNRVNGYGEVFSGGAIGGSGSVDEHSIDAVTYAGTGDNVTLDAGNLVITAAGFVGKVNSSSSEANIDASTGGIAAAAGGSASLTMELDTQAKIGEAVSHYQSQGDDPVQVTVRPGEVVATNDGNIYRYGADEEVSLDLTSVDFSGEDWVALTGNDITIDVIGWETGQADQQSLGQLTVTALNSFDIDYLTNFSTGGALAGAGVSTDVSTGSDYRALAVLGGGSMVDTEGRARFAANGSGDIKTKVNSEIYGVGTIGIYSTDVDIDPVNSVDIYGDLTSVRDVQLFAGLDENLYYDDYDITARLDSFAGSAIPIDNLDARATLTPANSVTVHSDADILTSGSAFLWADKVGVGNMLAKAKSNSWIAAIAAGADMVKERSSSGGTGVVTVDGKVETGHNRARKIAFELTLDGDGNATTNSDGDFVITTTQYVGKDSAGDWQEYTGADQPFGYSYSTQAIETELFHDRQSAMASLAGALSDDAVSFYTDQIAQIEAELLDLGLAEQVGNDIVPLSPDVVYIDVAPIFAQTGYIDLRGDVVTGSSNGSMIAPTYVDIEVVNNTPARLRTNGITVPDAIKGVYFNGDRIADVSFLQNRFFGNVSLEADRTVDPGELPPPSIILSSLDDWLGSLDSYSGPTAEIFLNADADGFALNAPSESVSVLVEGVNSDFVARGEISVYAIDAEASGTVTISGGIKYNIVGEPSTNVRDGNNANSAGWGQPINGGDYNDYLNNVPNDPNLRANEISITANYINIDGYVRAGFADYEITIDKTAADAEISASNRNHIFIRSASTDFARVYFNKAEQRFEIDDIRVKGGKIELDGEVVATRSGKLEALGGYGRVTVNNHTNHDVLVSDVNASFRGEGLILINGQAYRAYDDPAIDNEIIVGLDTSTYNPQSGQRYGWTVVTLDREVWNTVTGKSSWLGADWAARDPENVNWGSSEVVNTGLKEGSDFFFSSNDSSQYYSPDATSALTEEPKVVSAGNWKKSTWYGTTTYYQRWVKTTFNETVQGHSIEADKPVNLEFTGYNSGDINIIQHGSGSILLDGDLKATNGAISLKSAGNITQLNDYSRMARFDDQYVAALRTQNVITNNITLEAEGSIGGESSFSVVAGEGEATTAVDLVNGFGMTASDDNIAMNITVKAGDDVSLVIGSAGVKLVDDNNIAGIEVDGDVSLAVRGDIVSTSATGISSGSADLYASAGGVYERGGDGLLNLSMGDELRDSLKVVARDSIALAESAGDVRVDRIHSLTDGVTLSVSGGNLLDVNGESVTDERAVAELSNTVWGQLGLTEATGANEKIAAIQASKVTSEEKRYNDYWDMRLATADTDLGGAVDGGLYLVSETADGYSLYRPGNFQASLNVDSYADSDLAMLDDTELEIILVAEDGSLATLQAYQALSESEQNGYTRYSKQAQSNGGYRFVQVGGAALVAASITERADLELLDDQTNVWLSESGDLISTTAWSALDTSAREAYSFFTRDNTAAAPSSIDLALADADATGVSYYLSSNINDVSAAIAFDFDDLVTGKIDLGVGTLADGQAYYLRSTVAYDADTMVSISSEEEAAYRAAFEQQGLTDSEANSAIDTLNTARNDSYHATHSDLVDYFARDDISGDLLVRDGEFSYELSEDQIAALPDVHIWTDAELLNMMGAGALKQTTTTQTTIEAANIVAAAGDVVLSLTATGAGDDRRGGSIGEPGTVTIITNDGDFTKDERLALAVAERQDVAYLIGTILTTTVDASASSGNLVLTDNSGSVNFAERFSALDKVKLMGETENEILGQDYAVVESVSSTNIVLSGVATPVVEFGVEVTLGQVVAAPIIENFDASFVSTGGNEGTLARHDGQSFATIGYEVGQSILIGGNTANGGSDEWLITALDGNSATLSGSYPVTEEAVVDGQLRMIEVAQALTVSYIAVEQREDFDIDTSTGVLK